MKNLKSIQSKLFITVLLSAFLVTSASGKNSKQNSNGANSQISGTDLAVTGL